MSKLGYGIGMAASIGAGLAVGTGEARIAKGAYDLFKNAHSASTVTRAGKTAVEANRVFNLTKESSQTITKISAATKNAGLFVQNAVTKGGVKKIECMSDLLIKETLHGKGYFTSRYKPNASQVLEAGEKFLGRNYKSIGRPGDGVYRSADSLRQFRIDSNSLTGKHDPWIPHVHLETFKPENIYKPYVNNHIPFIE
jgi:hypothetical protein